MGRKNCFWGQLNECVSSFRWIVRVIVLGDVNARVGNELVVNVIGKYEVLGRNDIGEVLTGLSLEREFLVGILDLRRRMLTNIHGRG